MPPTRPTGPRPGMGAAIPVVRVFDTAIADDFYLRVLGFHLDWEHFFEPGMPRYAQVSRDDARLHLSEHGGDGSPGIVVWIPIVDLHGLQARILREAGDRLRPGIDDEAPGGPTMQVHDPFGNRLRFCHPLPS